MREIQAMCKRKQEEKAKPMKALWRDSKYDNVLPKVTPTHQTMTSKSSPASPLSSSSPNFVKTYSCTDIANASKTSTPHADNAKISHESKRSVRPRSSSLSRLSRSSTLPELSNNRKPSKNFIASNVEAVKNCKLKGEENLKQDNKKERAKGTIPKYLTERKLQWKEEEEKRIKELPDPSAPPGHTKLPDSEKNKTLEMLLAKQDQLLQILNKLPISAHTTGVKQRREETEKQLNEIDEGIKIFSRKVVYIKN
ncbi:Enkurin domain-containing protein 1 [Nymphon striatum]|nr:Enkurin domain-containing protein 1 [Nymphon striatum]